MNILIVLLLLSLLGGQLTGIPISPGVVVYIHDIILTLIIIVSLPRVIHNLKVFRTPLIKPIILFIAAAFISLGVNYWRYPLKELLTGSLYLVRWIFYSLTLILVLENFVAAAFWLNGLFAVGVGFATMGLAQFVLYPNLRNLMYLGWDPHYYRLFSTLLDPNYMGIILVFTLLLGFGIAKKKHRTWIMFGQVIAFIALLLTYSRSSYLALVAAIIVWAIIQKRWKLLSLVAAFACVLLVLPRIPGDTLKLTRLDSSLARVGNWKESLQLISKAPVFGYGFNTLRFLRSGDVMSKSASGLDSSILFIFVTTGAIGLFAYAFIIFSMIKLKNRTLNPVYLASLSALLVHSLFVNSMFYPWVMIWIWILTGAIICGK